MLRIVHPAREGQGTRSPGGRRRPRSARLSLNAEELQHFRAALGNIARAYGSRACLAEVIGIPAQTLHHAADRRRRPCGMLVIRLAQAGGMSVEAVLGGALSPAGRCKACGTRIGTRPATTGGAR
jgi:hypothetical protein